MIRAAIAASVAVFAALAPASPARSEDQPPAAPAENATPPARSEQSPARAPAPSAAVPIAPNSPDSVNGRYAFSRLSDSFLRLDTRTGQVSLCSQRAVGWACQLMPDDRAVLEGEIARLQRENAALKKDMIARGLPLPGGLPGSSQAPVPPVTQSEPPATTAPPAGKAEPPVAQAEPPAAKPPAARPEINLPSDEELERMMTFMEKLWRRLIEMVQNAQKNMEKKS